MFKLCVVLLVFVSVQLGGGNLTYTVVFPLNEFYPQYEVKDNLSRGLLPEIIKKFSSDENLNIQIKSMPVKRYLLEFYNNNIDFVFPDNPNWDDESKKKYSVSYSNIVMKSVGSFLVGKEQSEINLEQLKSIATIRGYTLPIDEEILKKRKINVFYVNSLNNLIQMLKSKRVESIFFHESIALTRLSSFDKIEVAANLPKIEYSYHLSTIKQKSLMLKFNSWLIANKSWIENKKRELSILSH